MVRTQISQTDDADADLAAMREAFGAWTDREIDGAIWVEQRRSGERLVRGGPLPRSSTPWY
jgi:hypothetical protein